MQATRPGTGVTLAGSPPCGALDGPLPPEGSQGSLLGEVSARGHSPGMQGPGPALGSSGTA